MKAETPTEIKDITKEWVEEILTEARSSPIRVKAVDVQSATQKGDNFNCVLATADVETEDGEEISIMIKLAPTGNPMKQYFFKEALLFEKEAFAYMHLARDLNNYQINKFGEIKINLPFPKCLYIKKEEDGRAVIVMENLRKLGFRMLEKKTDIDYDHAITALKGLSKLHAVSFAMKKDKGIDYVSAYPWIGRSFIVEMASMKDWFQSIFNPIISVLEGIPGQEEYSKRLKAYQDSIDVVKRYEELSAPKEPMALVAHGDFWKNNMMFKYSEGSTHPTDFRMLDLQICRYTQGVNDLVHYIFTSTTGTFREKHLNEVLRVYYNSFMHFLTVLEVKFDAADFPFDQLIKDFDDRVELGYIMSAVLIPMLMVNEEQMQEYDNIKEEDLKEAMEDLNKSMKTTASKEAQRKSMDLVKDMSDRKII